MKWFQVSISGDTFEVTFRCSKSDYPEADDEFNRTSASLLATALTDALKASEPVVWRQSQTLAYLVVNLLSEKGATVKQVAGAETAFFLAAEKLSEAWGDYDEWLYDVMKPTPEAQEQGAADE